MPSDRSVQAVNANEETTLRMGEGWKSALRQKSGTDAPLPLCNHFIRTLTRLSHKANSSSTAASVEPRFRNSVPRTLDDECRLPA